MTRREGGEPRARVAHTTSLRAAVTTCRGGRRPGEPSRYSHSAMPHAPTGAEAGRDEGCSDGLRARDASLGRWRLQEG